MNEKNEKLNTSSSNFTMMNLLDQMGISDPRLRMIAEFMSQQNQSDLDVKEDEEILQKKQDISNLRQQDVSNLRQIKMQNKELLEENEYLSGRLEILAAALGSCPECWGEYDDCEFCQGRGIPGTFLPEKQAFVEFVLPALNRLRGALKKIESNDQRSHKNNKQSVKSEKRTDKTKLQKKEVKNA